MTDGAHNRRSFRISETVYLRYQVLTEQEFASGIDRHKIGADQSEGVRSRLIDLDARIDETLFLMRGKDDKVTGCLSLLNDKLNIVIDQLPAFRESRASLARQKPQTCELSADGMVFGTTESLLPGTKILLNMLLEADSRFIETFCRVVRTTDAPDANGESCPIGIAVEFVGMKPAQKELLIQHLFSRESETLRMRRLELDA
jgi:c-di-GMP-binding flagellar brake protein YcgR